ncbi:MAG: TRL-like family protein [Candidatus Brocadiia bacterium]|jgi:hypothetical protein
MRRNTFLAAALLIGVMLSGCAMAPVVPPRGILYNDQKAPLFGGKEIGSKEGRASTYTLLFLVGWGDSSVTAAARDAGISEVKQLNYQMFSILGLYQRYTTIVRGD